SSCCHSSNCPSHSYSCLQSLSLSFFFYCSAHHRHLLSFPTRRSSDLLLDNDVDESLITTIPDTDDVAILNQTRIRLEVLYQQVLEKQYAMEQTKDEQVKETIAYLKKLDKQPVEEDIEIEDEPAYLEW